MPIRILSENQTIETTLLELLQTLQAVTDQDDEVEAVLAKMLNEDRLHFEPDSAQAA